MKIIQKVGMLALLVNFVHSAELPEDHPIKTAVQMAKFAFLQHNYVVNDIEGRAHNFVPALLRSGEIHDIQRSVEKCLKNYVDFLFLQDELTSVFILMRHFDTCVNKKYFTSHHWTPHHTYIDVNLAAITTETDTYIHQSFEKHFQCRKNKWEFSSACKLALVYRDANTTHEDNTKKANKWIVEIEEKATAEITKLARTVTALIGVPDLELDYRIRAEEIINSFPIESQLRIDLQTQFEAILAEPRPLPNAARLTLQRDIAERLFT